MNTQRRIIIFLLVIVMLLALALVWALQKKPERIVEQVFIETSAKDGGKEDQNASVAQRALSAAELWKDAQQQTGDQYIKTLTQAAQMGHVKSAMKLVRMNQWYAIDSKNEYVQLWEHTPEKGIHQLWLFAACNKHISRANYMTRADMPEEEREALLHYIRESGALEPSILYTCAIFLARNQKDKKDTEYFLNLCYDQCTKVHAFYLESEIDESQARLNMEYAALKEILADIEYQRSQFVLAKELYEDVRKRALLSNWNTKAHSMQSAIQACEKALQQ